MRRSAIAFAFAVVLVAPGAFADDATPPPATPTPAGSAATPPGAETNTAEQHFQRGKQLFDEGDYALSLVEFSRAYELSPSYRVLFNIAQINIQLFNYAAAQTALEKYLKDGGDDIPPPRKQQAERDLQMLRGRTARLKIHVPAGAEVALDDAPIGTAPFAEPRLVNAGQRKIVVSRPGFITATKVLTLAGGDAQIVEIALVPVPKDDRPQGPNVRTTMTKNYTPAIIGWASTGVLAAGAAVFGAMYLGKQSDLESYNDPSRNVPVTTKESEESTATRLAVAADVFGLLAVAAAGVATYFTLRPPQSEKVVVGKVRPSPSGFVLTF